MLSKYAINDIYYVINYVFMLSIRCNNTSKIIPGMGQISTLGRALPYLLTSFLQQVTYMLKKVLLEVFLCSTDGGL